MNASGLHHVSVGVVDVDEAAGFYREVLGLVPLDRPDFGFPGAWFAFPDGRQVHLIGIDGPAGSGPGHHLAIRVDDLDDAVATLTAKGWPVDVLGELPGAGRQAFLSDPSGNVIELNQPT